MNSPRPATTRWTILAVAGALAAVALWSRSDDGTSGEASSTATVPPPPLDGGRLAAAPRAGNNDLSDAASTIVGVVERDGKPSAAHVVLRLVDRMRDGVRESAFRRASDQRKHAASAPASPIVASARADADGRFTFAGVGEGAYVLDAIAASSDGDARGRASVEVPIAGVRVEARVPIRTATLALRGRVLFADGMPWRGRVRLAPVDLWPRPDDGDPSIVWATTDESGRFEARGLPSGTVLARPLREGIDGDTGSLVTLPATSECVLMVPIDGPTVSGTVTSEADGTPLAGATVSASAWRGGERRTTTASDGSFSVVAPAPGDLWTVRAHASGYTPGVARIRLLATPTGGAATARADLALVRAATIRGRVRDPDGAPAVGVVVYARRAAAWSADPAATTDERGRFEIGDVEPGEVGLYPLGRGFVPREFAGLRESGWDPCVVTAVAGATVDADLVVARGARASGTVRDEQGAPVAGALVLASPVSAESSLGARTIVEILDVEHAAASDTEGRFAFDALGDGVAYGFSASVPSRSSARAGALVAHDAAPLVVDLSFSSRRRVKVRVVEAESRAPVVGAQVGWPPHLTDASGIVFVDVDLKQTTLRIAADGRETSELTFAPTETDATAVMDAREDVEITVRMPDGTPAAGAMVEVLTGVLLPDPRALVACDGEGRASLPRRSDMQGLGALRWTAQGLLSSRSRAFREGRRTVLPLVERDAVAAKSPDGKTIEVSVIDSAGVAIPRATLLVRNSVNDSLPSARKVIDGHATIDADRAALLEVVRPTTAAGTPLPLGVGWLDVAAGAERAEVRLAPDAPIAGVVLDADGRPAASVVVEATPERVPPSHRFDHSAARARTDATGAFRLSGTGAETYRLVVSPPAGSCAPEPSRATGGVRDVVLRLRRGIAARVTVLEADGTPSRSAFVSATKGPHDDSLDADSRSLASSAEGAVAAGADGVAVLRSLDPDAAYELYAVDPERRKEVRGRSIADWKPADTTVTLPESLEISGVVRDTQGRPVPEAWVTAKREGRDLDSAFSRAGGTFTIEGLSRGAVDLHAEPPGKMEDPTKEPKTARIVANAGTSGVVLVVAPGATLVVRIAGWRRARGESRRAVLTREPIASDSPTHTESVEPDGVARFRGLTATASYTLWIPPTAGDDLDEGDAETQRRQFVYAQHLRPGAAETSARLESGRPIRGRVVAPSGATIRGAYASAPGLEMSTRVAADGRYAFVALPEIPLGLEAVGDLDGRTLRAQADTTAGSTVDLDLTPHPPR